jgi:hypothetical protein
MNKRLLDSNIFIFSLFALFSIFLIFLSAPQVHANACFNTVTFDCYDSVQTQVADSGACASTHTFFAQRYCPQTIASDARFNWDQVVPQLAPNGCCVQRFQFNRVGTLVANATVCSATQSTTGFPNQTIFFPGITTQNSCNAKANENNVFDQLTPTQMCSQAGGVWCSTGSVTQSDIISTVPLDSINHANQVCARQCGTQTLTCASIPGSTGTFPLNLTSTCPADKQLDSQTCCVQPTLSTCQNIGGSYCGSCQSAILDITSRVGDFTGRSGTNQVCCKDIAGGVNGCFVPSSTTCRGWERELICNDNIDDDCDGLIDIYDSDCGATASGRVDPTTISSRGVTVIAIDTRTLPHGLPVNYTTTTLLNGQFVFANLPKTGTFNFTVLNYPSTSTVRNFTNTSTNIGGIVLTINGTNFATLTGQIREAGLNSRFIPGAFVFIPNTPYFAYTDAVGRFSIPNILPRPQSYEFSIKAVDYEPRTITLALPNANNYAVNWTLTPTYCQANAVFNITALNHVVGQPHVQIQYSLNDCVDKLQSLQIRRCEVKIGQSNQTCANMNQFDVIHGANVTLLQAAKRAGQNTLTVLDTNEGAGLNWNTTYRYFINATYAQVEPASTASQIRNITLGNALCAGRNTQDQFCGRGTLIPGQPGVLFIGGLTCNAQNQITPLLGNSTRCTAGQTCVERRLPGQSTFVQCVNSQVCAVESTQSGILSMFFPRSQQSQCINPQNTGGAQCYYDVKTSNVNTCLLCKPEMTCADYKTQSACTSDQNTCRVGKSSNGCVWEPLPGGADGLTTGVCRDASVSLCEECNSGSVFSTNACNKLSCEKLTTGNDRCVFSEKALECRSEKKITCYDFNSAASCQNAPAQLNCKVNPSVFAEQTGFVCVRDTNQNDLDDCNEPLNSSIISQIQCRSDNSPPKTIAILPNTIDPAYSTEFIAFIVVDPDSPVVIASPIKETKYCVNGPTGGDVCRDLNSPAWQTTDATRRVGVATIATQFLNFDPTRTNTLYYYSIDQANNREVVKSVEFKSDFTVPQITQFTYTQLFDPNASRSSVVYEFRTSKPAICASTLNGVSPTSRTTSLSTSHTFMFRNIQTGSYQTTVTCVDNANNEFSAEYIVIVSGDGTFGDIRPVGTVGLNQVNLTFTTNFNRICRYSDQQLQNNPTFSPNFGQGAFARTVLASGQTSQLATVTVQPGLNYYTIVCQPNTPPDGLFDPSLVISFIGDLDGPSARALTTTGEPFQSDIQTANSTIVFECLDNPQNGFGCARISYCDMGVVNGNFPVESCAPNITLTTTQKDGNLSHISGSRLITKPTRICYQSVERNNIAFPAYGGGRASAVECINVNANYFAPYLRVSQIPKSTTTPSITLQTEVFTIVDSLTNVQLSAPLSSAPDNVQYLSSDTFADMYLRTEISYAQQTGQHVEFNQVLRRTTGANPTQLVVGFNTQENRTYIAQMPTPTTQNPNPQKTILASVNQILSGNRIWEITTRNTQIELKISSPNTAEVLSLNATTTHTNPGFYGFSARRLVSNSPLPTIQNYLVGYPSTTLSHINIDIHPLVSTNNSVLSRGEATNTVQRLNQPNVATHTFNIVSQEQLVHGLGFDILTRATEVGLSQRSSLANEQRIFIDLDGPSVTQAVFAPKNPIPGQTKIYAGQDAQVTLTVQELHSDISGQGITIQVGDQINQIKTLQNITIIKTPTAYSVIGTINTVGLLVSDNQDVSITMRDSLGNVRVSNVSQALSLSIPTEFGTLTYPSPLYVNSANVSYGISFNNNPQPITCEVEYKNKFGQTITDAVSGAGSAKTVTLSQELPSRIGEELSNNVIIYCTTTVGSTPLRVGVLQQIIYDLKPPLLTILDSGNFELINEDLQTNYKEYAGSFLSPRVVAHSDEPILCKYTTADSGLAYAQWEFLNIQSASQTFALTHTSGPLGNASGQQGQFSFIITCQDRAGNTGINQTIFYNLNSNIPLNIIDPKPTGYTNQNPVKFELRTYTSGPVLCYAEVLGHMSRRQLTPTVVSGTTAQRLHQLTQTFSEGTYVANLSCVHNNIQVSQNVGFVVDYTAPFMNITVEPQAEVAQSTTTLGGIINESGKVKVYVNNDLVSQKEVSATSSADATFSFTIPVQRGANTVRIVGEDLAGNTISKEFIVTRAQSGVDVFILGVSNSVFGNLPQIPIQLQHTNTVSNFGLSARIVDLNGNVIYTYSTSDIQFVNVNLSQLKAKDVNVDPVIIDGEYILEVIALAGSSPVGFDSAAFTLDRDVPTNRIVTPGFFIRTTSQEIISNTTYTQVLDTTKDSIKVLDLLTNTGKSVTVTRIRELLRATNSFTEGRAFEITVESAYHGGNVAKTSQVSVFDIFGPRATIAVRGASGNLVRTPSPIFEYTFNEPALITQITLRQGATNLPLTLPVQTTFITNGTYTLPYRLALDGEYQIILTARDTYGNVANSTFAFTHKFGEIEARLEYPSFGVSNESVGLLKISTDRMSECYYGYTSNFTIEQAVGVGNSFTVTSTDGREHEVTNFAFSTFGASTPTLYVKCMSGDGGSNENTNALETRVYFVNRAPNINFVISEAPSTNVLYTYPPNGQVTLNVTTDQPSICRYNADSNANWPQMGRFGDESQLRQIHSVKVGANVAKDYVFNVTCFNGHYYTTQTKSLKVDYSLGDDIRIESPQSGSASQNSSVVVQVRTKRALESLQNCKYVIGNGTQSSFINVSTDGLLYSSGTLNLAEGAYELEVICQVRANPALPYNEVKAFSEFFIDKTAPVIYNITVPTNTTTKSLTAVINASDNISGIAYYEVSIGTEGFGTPGALFNTIKNSTITQNNNARQTFNGLNLTNGETYYWTIRAFDKAGNTQSSYIVSSGTTYLEQSTGGSTRPTCFDGKKNGDETDIDCGGSCGTCGTNSACILNSDCASKNCGALGICLAPTCTDNVKNGLETGVDCGGSCATKCPIGQGCSINGDCNEGVCASGVCADATCQNGKFDLTETDVDCGGICGPCNAGKACVIDRDCAGGTSCSNGVCKVVTPVTPPTPPPQPPESNSGLAWYWWLLIVLLIILLGIGGFYAYTVALEEERKKNIRNMPPPPIMRMEQTPPSRSMHDQLKEALQKKLENERKMAQGGHPVFTEASIKPKSENIFEKSDKSTEKSSASAKETIVTEETIEEQIKRDDAKKSSIEKLAGVDDPKVESNDKLDKLRRLAKAPGVEIKTDDAPKKSKEALSKLKELKKSTPVKKAKK